MPTDPNWLYSTIAQSSAALVAIVGGFVLSRLLTLSAERNGSEMRLEEIGAELEPKQKELRLLRDRRLRWDVSDHLLTGKVLDALVDAKGEMSLADAITSASFRWCTPADLQPAWDDYRDDQGNLGDYWRYGREIAQRIERDRRVSRGAWYSPYRLSADHIYRIKQRAHREPRVRSMGGLPPQLETTLLTSAISSPEIDRVRREREREERDR